MEGLRLVSNSESNVWQYGLLAAGPIRTSLPWCFLALRDRPLSGALPAVQEGGRSSESNVWQMGCWLLAGRLHC